MRATSVIYIVTPETDRPTAQTLLGALRLILMMAGLLGCAVVCRGQGTMTFRFEGQPRGTSQLIGGYSEAGMQFGMAYGPGSLILTGGGIAGYPDNGTGYLEMPDGDPGGSGNTRLRFGFNVFPPGIPVNFNLISFDAARYGDLAPPTLQVVGYKYQVMAPPSTVTNYFTVTSPDFQTFYPDSSFAGVFQVDVFNARWSLDNLVISGVPEPSGAILVLLGALSGLGWSRSRR